VIVGLGKTGLSCARYLHSKGEPFRIVDSRAHPPYLDALQAEMPEVAVELGEFSASTFANASALIVSPGLSIRLPAIEKAASSGVSITGDIDIFSKSTNVPIIAVTGSNGKSTVSMLVAKILSDAGLKVGLGGNLDAAESVPALDLLSGSNNVDYFVLEVSSFQLETTDCIRAEVALILNFSEDHMDRYKDIQSYLDAKRRVFCESRKIVVNLDCEFSQPPETTDAELFYFGMENQPHEGFGITQNDKQTFVTYRGEKLFSTNELKIRGNHNVSNVIAAMTVASAVGINLSSTIESVKQFAGLANRCQWIANIDGVDYYNDSKGTNVGATVAAIEGLGQSIPNKIILIAGGDGKGADFLPLKSIVESYCRAAVLIGKDARKIANAIEPAVSCHYASDMTEALQSSRSIAQPGDSVLLSPACASFDMYRDYIQRGEIFSESVRSLQ